MNNSEDAKRNEVNTYTTTTALGFKFRHEIIKKPDGKIVKTSEMLEGPSIFKGQKQVVEINPNDKNPSGKMSNITLKGNSSQKEPYNL